MTRKHFSSFAAIAAALLAAAAFAQSPADHHHSFGDAQKWAQEFDDPSRDAWQKPHEVIQALKLKPDDAVADIGAGTGYFTVRLAHNVPQGRVYGVDIEPEMVKYLTERAQKQGLANVTAIAGAADDPRLPAKVDVILLVDVYHHIDNRDAYFRKLRDSLKPGGRVAIIDFRMDSSSGPPKSARIAPARVQSELKKAGYALAAQHAFLPNQYFLVFSQAQGTGR